jgi:hypothetical protein
MAADVLNFRAMAGVEGSRARVGAIFAEFRAELARDVDRLLPTLGGRLPEGGSFA